ncbi:uncharacterized protein TRAVEDRAFT_168885 [Trametes versicolor FP-101664 SS1]|uniref:uncharacterized protein n=1 Tax=Trametes versicolor (strain FP-101664) TaxID=717944 RepID=UPI0004621DD3|nr:uncharacterized protein TRAVEDRAFT_168885 [Trametes versicolor FP-101664 SS1]EIW57247.1 hypothetical protein TRAVEDRAFT_168885 [Trametes versicolor FP-101664 SS1]
MPGLLLVYSEPGAAVPDAEFNDWYDNEHVPLRLPIPGIHSWSRWAAADGARPTYAALYDLASPAVISEPPYADLAGTRSARETDIFARVALLDRRTYTLREPVFPPKAGAAYDARAPGPYAVVVEVEVKPETEDEFNKWYEEEHIPLLAKVPGWVRSRRFVLEDAAAAGPEATAGTPPKHLTIHEWEGLEAMETKEFKEAVSTPWMQKIQETAIVDARRRVLKFVRSWDRQ